jgi:hypothetical protein
LPTIFYVRVYAVNADKEKGISNMVMPF